MPQLPPVKEDCEVGAEISLPSKKGSIASDEYDPYEYGNEDEPTEVSQTVFHLLKGIIGSGILTLPFIFKNVGYVIGIVGMLLVSLLYTHILRILLSVEYALCKRLKTPNLTYVNVVQKTFETGPSRVKWGKPFCVFLLYFHYIFNGILGSANYILIIASNFKTVFDYYDSLSVAPTNTGMTIFSTVTLFLLFLLGLIPNFRYLAPLSAVTSAFNFVNIVLILWIAGTTTRSAEELKPFGELSKFPQFFAISVNALGATGLILPLKNDMKEPKKFGQFFGALNLSMSVIAAIYVAFGFMGYLRYGDEAEANMLLNLPPDHVFSFLIKALYSLSVCVTYTLFVFIYCDMIWANILKGKTENYKYNFLIPPAIKTILTLISYAVAVSIPNFGIIASLAGTLGILIDIGVPPLLQILTLISNSEQSCTTYLLIGKDLLIILFTLFLFVFGFIDVIQDMIKFFNGHPV